MTDSYRIIDEPERGSFRFKAVHPRWILIATVFCGPWLAWPWEIFNSYALQSPAFWRDVAVAVGGFAGLSSLVFGFYWLVEHSVAPGWSWPYLLMVIALWKAGIGYTLNVAQLEAFALYEYCDGSAGSGLPIAIAGGFLNTAFLPSSVRDGLLNLSAA